MKNNYSYIGIALIILVFGIIFVPKIVNRIKDGATVEKDRMNIEGTERNKKLLFIKINGKARSVPEFLFTNQDSLEISNIDFKGKVTVMEFFFASCPTICPVMNRNMRTLDDEFHERDDFAIASFTIDPENDTPKALKEYAERYGVKSLNWHFLTGDLEKIHALSNTGFNIFAGINPEVAGGFEHQGYFALIDKNGFIRSRKDNHGNPKIYYQGTDEKEVAMLKEDIKNLLEEE
ncbi:SCO family protein [Kordia sp. YSTF-M3]|uniref:SCO family protein n=1 Tax=Kordia aestuariivivens TaxID=2759037 RepID=A0ABR7Q422_9FLAO|nr:SCO family protein [Kordia aestuariivivens]MBC8753094.1 SCO family protein [Kordia aestuariivivens]